MNKKDYVIGVDYGTDSVRALLVDARTGEELASEVHVYSRYKAGKYTNAEQNQFRHHPLDYIEGLEFSITGCLNKAPGSVKENVRGIAIDSTGSTIAPVNRKGAVLALLPEFKDNPNAMFVLWKDHTAIKEAAEINDVSRTWGGIDFTRYEGGIYSAEWFWAKILHVIREDTKVREAAFSWVELCDWIPAILTGTEKPADMKRSRCAAGHKAMWHESWGGLPDDNYLIKIDPLLKGLKSRLYWDTYTSDIPAGILSAEWKKRLGLRGDVAVGVGAFDCHMGAVGAGVEPYVLVKIVGTSTCDVLVISKEDLRNKLIKGICGQVDGSVIPGMIGLEAGQSGFGDIYAWFRSLLQWPVQTILQNSKLIDSKTREILSDEIYDKIIPALTAKAAKLPLESSIIAEDWFNGRRTPDANQLLKGAITGLNLGSDAPRVFKALIEATAFGARAVNDRFESEGIPIKKIIAIGGISKKSDFIMQTLADILGMPIKIGKSDNVCALGAAMFAAVAAGVHKTIADAQKAMNSGYVREFTPISDNVKKYAVLYKKYQELGSFIENTTK
jgi:L-ribulokinase